MLLTAAVAVAVLLLAAVAITAVQLGSSAGGGRHRVVETVPSALDQ